MTTHPILLLWVLAFSVVPATSFAATQPMPCEKVLGELKAAIKSATPTDADKAKIADLQAKGLERCKADDDAGPDSFFAEALKLLPR